ncbi:hypothetical protein KJ693_03825 [bacterium]|nr:hypothetical protein [bacterium]
MKPDRHLQKAESIQRSLQNLLPDGEGENVEAIVELCYGIVQHLIAYGMEHKYNKHLDSHVGLAKFLTTNGEEEISEKFINLDILRQGRWYGGKGNGGIVKECLKIVEEIKRWARK